MHRALKWFAVLTTIGMLLILLGGALVTKTDSGMGCGRSWPLCDGKFVPSDITPELVIELAHRLVSGSVGFMVLILSVWAWRKIGHKRETKFLSLLSCIFLLAQALIGAAAVIWGQSDFVLALHFGISLISFASVFLLTLLIFEVDKKFESEKLIIDKRMKFHITGIMVYSFIVVYSGALVRHTKSSLICKDWPLCVNSSPGLPGNIFQWVQMGHRAAAGIIFIWVAYAAIIAIRHYKHQKVLYWGWVASLVLVFLQVCFGALIIFSRLNLYIALGHALFISCFFGVMSYLLLLSSRSKKNSIALEKTQAGYNEAEEQL
ncbi:heme A synthase [Peribacillus cavernae]|uniref:Heme A synthase n=1 Tax=Peribacillus cavernae TaxID=1674310 RepID=A0A433HPU6_9BACI|nr:heme A synthase [Peribacillus cavernae]MDQ0217211.1 cytochrome c oxidase assembly protein subunit 15 [Peribacillus cavernae]RUQ30318.1 heme A synthase [Peribacillus cavernae]